MTDRPKIQHYMATKLKSPDGNMDIVEAANTFLSSDFRLFPVLTDGRLVGQISRSDILRALAQKWL